MFAGFQVVNDYLSLDDIVDYTLLFFRVLKRSQNVAAEGQFSPKSKQTRFGSFSAGNLNHHVSWNEVSLLCFGNLKAKRLRSQDKIPSYLSRFDSLTEKELLELDRLIGLCVPDDDYFKEFVIENEVNYVLSQLIDSTIIQTGDEPLLADGNNRFAASQAESKHSGSTGNSSHAGLDEYAENELYQRFLDDLKHDKLWQELNNLPYQQGKKCLANMFEMFKRTNQTVKEKRKQRSQNSFEKSMNEELNQQIVYCDHFAEDVPSVSEYLHYDARYIGRTEKESIRLMKMNYRLCHLEDFLKNSPAHNNEFDFYFGFWLNQIHKMLAQSDIIQVFGKFNSAEIEKVFFIVSHRLWVPIFDMLDSFSFRR